MQGNGKHIKGPYSNDDVKASESSTSSEGSHHYVNKSSMQSVKCEPKTVQCNTMPSISHDAAGSLEVAKSINTIYIQQPLSQCTEKVNSTVPIFTSIQQTIDIGNEKNEAEKTNENSIMQHSKLIEVRYMHSISNLIEINL